VSISLGLDIGGVSLKLAAVAEPDEPEAFYELLERSRTFRPIPASLRERAGRPAIVSEYRRILGSPAEAALGLLKEFYQVVSESLIGGVRVTGSGGRLIAKLLGVSFENEFKAIASAMRLLHPDVRTVFEMGGESSKYMLLEASGNGHAATGDLYRHLGIADFATSGECAAGTGSFLDQQASRLQHRVEEIGGLVSGAKCAARIAGRCSVFAKSDMIHAQQKGYGVDEILKGLCEAVARNLKSSLVKGKRVEPPVAFIGGVAQNLGVVEALRQAFRLSPGQLVVPELHSWLGAMGSALLEQLDARRRSFQGIRLAQRQGETASGAGLASQPAYPPLAMESVLLLRDRVQPYELPAKLGSRIPAFLGIDIGSVSTNLAVIDEAGRLLHGIYLYTVGRPIEVVHQGLQEIEQRLGSHIEIRGVGTTGSGRELIGELVGADTVNDEITAHKTGALYVHATLVAGNGARIGPVDTIFEIGGQDSKFISIERSVVVDFAMNEACAAGTGSFLEEQAERLGIQIKGEFARLALSSAAPARLGERCTVFMERDVIAALHRGAAVRDLAAGLAYSVALNYLNRVVRGRKIGEVIYFQGGTAYNDAVAAAFSNLLGKRIIVPPHNGVIGAIGAALIARDRATGQASAFRGYDLSRTRFQTRDFVCKACSNYCEMKEITIEGQKTYWGDKCSGKFRKRARTDRRPVIEDLIALRERALLQGCEEKRPANSGPRVGIPCAMFYYDRFPFWSRYLEGLGFCVVVSGATDGRIAARGIELSVAEPCFPVQVAHGHVAALLEAGVDYVLLPNVMDEEAPATRANSQLCPWNQTLPHVLRSVPAFAERSGDFLAPTVYFRLGRRHVRKQLADTFARLGISRRKSDAAVDSAYGAQASFSARVLEAGREAWATLERTGEPAVLLVGRPYNLYDRQSNCDIPRKLRDLYGVNVLPMDFLPLESQPVDDFHSNMYWNSGRRILAAGRFARQHPNLHVVYLTNFKCGPDSFIKHFMRGATDAPFLALQFDGHGNDAGYLTRCEAYLDSKGVLRCSSAPRIA
jgi:predicted CoA-substrate-specific enzyme activase